MNVTNEIFRVLYLSYDGMTDPLGQSQVIAYLKRLSQRGFEIDIISFEKPAIYAKKKELVAKDLQGTSITWHPLTYDNSVPVYSTWKIVQQAYAKAEQLHKQKQFHIVHCRAQVMAIVGHRLQKEHGLKFIFDMRGWWTDEKFDSGNWNELLFKPVYHYLKKQERKLISDSDTTITLTYASQQEIIKLGLKNAEDIGVIPTCVDFEVFAPYKEATRQELRDKLTLPKDAKVLVHSGSIGGSYSMEDLLLVFKAFQQVFPGAYFLLLSKSSDEMELAMEKIKQSDVDPSLIRIASVDFKQVHAYLMAADYGVILYTISYSVIGRSPTKLGEYWSSGLPVLSLKGIGDLDFIMEKYPEGGNLIQSIEMPQLVEGFRKLAAKGDKMILREAAIDYFSIEKGIDFYEEVYRNLLPNKRI